jgi:hypothetical protein
MAAGAGIPASRLRSFLAVPLYETPRQALIR